MTDHACDSGNFDRSICPPPCGSMHSYCTVCGMRWDGCAHDLAADDVPDHDPITFGPHLVTLEDWRDAALALDEHCQRLTEELALLRDTLRLRTLAMHRVARELDQLRANQENPRD